MTAQGNPKKQWTCDKCGKTYPNNLRLQHHRAAEHPLKTMADVHSMKDVRTGRDFPRR